MCRIISGKEHEVLQKECMKTVKIGRRQETQLDAVEYNRRLTLNSIVFPDLTDTALQESYGVTGATDLYNTMFNWAEQNLLMEAITDKSGLNEDINDLVDQAKK